MGQKAQQSDPSFDPPTGPEQAAGAGPSLDRPVGQRFCCGRDGLRGARGFGWHKVPCGQGSFAGPRSSDGPCGSGSGSGGREGAAFVIAGSKPPCAASTKPRTFGRLFCCLKVALCVGQCCRRGALGFFLWSDAKRGGTPCSCPQNPPNPPRIEPMCRTKCAGKAPQRRIVALTL